MYTILLYYKYVRIEDPKAFMEVQRALCEKLGLKGRIIVAEEGINGTVEGLTENAEAYVIEMKQDPRFADIHWKRSAGTSDGRAFPRLSVKARKEIVSAHLDDLDPHTGDVDPTQLTATHLKPETLRQWFEEGKQFSIVDMRNNYEHAVGQFKGAHIPKMSNFRDLSKVAEEIADLKEKPVLTVCTGGVRCEKASGYLLKKGFKDVYQLDGGIVSYMEQFPGRDFEGSLYVFDGRVTMNFNDPKTHQVIGRCGRCAAPSERYVNCHNLACHDHLIICEGCSEADGAAFCLACAKTPVV